MFQEYDFEVVVKTGKLNAGLDYLSCILSREDTGNLYDNLLNAHFYAVKMVENYFKNIVHILRIGMAPSDMTVAQKKDLVVKEIDYQLIAGK
jgi:hypothetical protein